MWRHNIVRRRQSHQVCVGGRTFACQLSADVSLTLMLRLLDAITKNSDCHYNLLVRTLIISVVILSDFL